MGVYVFVLVYSICVLRGEAHYIEPEKKMYFQCKHLFFKEWMGLVGMVLGGGYTLDSQSN